MDYIPLPSIHLCLPEMEYVVASSELDYQESLMETLADKAIMTLEILREQGRVWDIFVIKYVEVL